MPDTAEHRRLAAAADRSANWQRWGPYLSERQWGTVREDQNADGNNWTAFPYEQSLGRTYRWGEDGLLGLTDRECRLCLAPAVWNGRDPHLKERLFGLTNPEGNHAEDVKEVYFYLDGTPTGSYLKALYKYPQGEFPYEKLRDEAKRRTRDDTEFELTDTPAFAADRYWDLFVEVAKGGPDDLLVKYTAHNRGPEAATLHLLPTLWFRNTWCWDAAYDEARWAKPSLTRDGDRSVVTDHESLGRFRLTVETPPAEWLFTENETNPAVVHRGGVLGAVGRGLGLTGGGAYKDAFHEHVVQGKRGAEARSGGTKAAAVYKLDVPAGGQATVRLRLTAADVAPAEPFADFDQVFADRLREADEFYAAVIPPGCTAEQRHVSRQAYAGLVWSRQFYHWVPPDWISRDGERPPEDPDHPKGPNRGWDHLFARDVLSMPDKWEYPAFFAWDTAFHMVPTARIDPHGAKHELLTLLREWYLHPNGQLPAFEYDLSNVNPPVHAWACWQVYLADGKRDKLFLERAFHKLLMNFTWWVNRKDAKGRGVFGGGFLGMDNLGVFDRSRPLPVGDELQQADGTAWMGFYSTQMLEIALELALHHNPAYEDVASKFFEHFVAIADALNHLGGRGMWDEEDGFYYDQLRVGTTMIPLKLRAMIGLVPLLANHILVEAEIRPKLPDFHHRVEWFLANRRDIIKQVTFLQTQGQEPKRRMLLALPTRDRLTRTLRRLLDETEFLSPFGVRSLSKVYEKHPYRLTAGGQRFEVKYVPGDMDTGDFGGNSNWRGPVWMPVNFLLIEALRKYHDFFGDDLRVECPVGSGVQMNMQEVAAELGRRLTALFVSEDCRPRPCHGTLEKFAADPHWKDHVLFYEYFHGDSGRGLGASHQTGWTALVATLIEKCR